MAARNDIGERKRYQALVLLAGDKKLSAKKISKITGLHKAHVSGIRRKYLLARLLGINVKLVADNVLLSHISSSLPIETYFCYCVLQYFVEAKEIDHAKIFLFAAGELCKRMDIDADEIEELDENSIMNGIELIKKQMKAHSN